MRFYFKTKDGNVYYTDELNSEALDFMNDSSCKIYANKKIYSHDLGGCLNEEEWLMIILKSKPLNTKND